MLNLIARWADRRALALVAGALLLAALAGVFGTPVTGTLSGGSADFATPGSDSARAAKTIENATGLSSDGGIVALVRLPESIDAAGSQARVAAVAALLRSEPSVARVASYFDSHDQSMVSRNKRQTFLLVQLVRGASGIDAAQHLQDKLRGATDVSLGGSPIVDAQVTGTVQEDLARAELLAFPVLFLLSLWIFRSLVASALPLVIGGLNVVTTLLVLRGISHFVDLSVFALNLVTALGLGLAIDYSLLIVSRFRSELSAAGGDASIAITRTVLTAGRTIVFSSLTVAAALATLTMFGQRFLYSMAIGGTVVALLSATVALLVLPAILRLLGRRIDSLAPRRWQRQQAGQDGTSQRWLALAGRVTNRPVLVAVTATAILVALGLPFLGVRFTSVSSANLPAAFSSRQVDDSLRSDFVAGPLDAIQVVMTPQGGDAAAVDRLRGELQRQDGVRLVAPAQRLNAATWLIPVTSRSGPLTSDSRAVVQRIRALTSDRSVAVSGQAARFADLRASLGAKLPWAVLVVFMANIVVLMLMTGSVVLPLKSVLMNVLSLAATFGILVVIFQQGHLSSLLGTTGQGALETTQPVLLFALVFGLSTDYGVFLLASIKEARADGVPDRQAVILGMGRTGRIVTAAALLFCVALGALATSRMVFIKELGIGTALGVLIDATIVRALLVPSLMTLLGSANWWGPRWLGRLAARVEGGEPRPAPSVIPGVYPAAGVVRGGRHRAPRRHEVRPGIGLGLSRTIEDAAPTGVGRHRMSTAQRVT